MFTIRYLLVTTLFLFGSTLSPAALSSDSNSKEFSKGKYLVEISGCNDCHTSGYAVSGGKTPEAQWLLGDGLGFRGAWGTTYPTNLRVYIGGMSETEWVAKAKALKTRPPMPWWILNTMTEDDLKEIYKYVVGLGVIEKEVPSYVPPGEQPAPPYIQWPLPPE